MAGAALELAVSRILSRGRLLEHALHDQGMFSWRGMAWAPEGATVPCMPFPLDCTVLADRVVIHGYLTGPFRASRVEIWYRGTLLDCRDLPRLYQAPLRMAFTVSIARVELAA